MKTHGAAGSKVLLVEDNSGDSMLVAELLDFHDVGAEPISLAPVQTMREAEDLLPGAFDAVILDLRLPDCEGLDCVHRVRAVAPNAAIVVLTGLDNESLGLECLAAGAQDYVLKQQMSPEILVRSIGYSVTRAAEAAAVRRVSALQSRLAAIVEASTDAILSCTEAGIVTSWNRGATEMFGYAPEEAVGRHVSDLIRVPEGEPDIQVEMIRRAAANAYGKPRELERLHRDGHRIAISALGFALPAEEGQGGIGAIARDITERRAQEAELLAQYDQLKRRDRQMRALTAHLNAIREEERLRISREVHDELGQLLTGLKMDLRWLERRGEGGTEITAKFAEATDLVDRTIATVQRIATELRPSALDALGLPSAIRDELRRFEERTGLAVSVDVGDGPLPDAATSTALFRILQELLTNVARHAEATNLAVGFTCEAEAWTLRVHDDGVGFEASDDPDWTSLGLLGMIERAEALGGTIELDSRPGLGTRAVVRIPTGQQGAGAGAEE